MSFEGCSPAGLVFSSKAKLPDPAKLPCPYSPLDVFDANAVAKPRRSSAKDTNIRYNDHEALLFHKDCADIDGCYRNPPNIGDGLRKLANIRVPDVHSAARNALYSRYTHKDWMNDFKHGSNKQDESNRQSDLIVKNMAKTALMSNQAAKDGEKETSKNFGQRISDTAYWKQEVDAEINRMTVVNEKLKDMVDNAIKLRDMMLQQKHLCETCIYNREKRCGIELIHDETETRLIDEMLMLKNFIDEIEDLICQGKKQIEANERILCELRVDDARKFRTLQIDDTLHNMHKKSHGVKYHHNVECEDTTRSVPETWLEHVTSLLDRSRQNRATSERLIEKLANTIERDRRTCAEKWNWVNAAMADRIRELTEARNLVQSALRMTINSLQQMTMECEKLRRVVNDKKERLRLATTRLCERNCRIDVENCEDNANISLRNEIHNLKSMIEDLEKNYKDIINTIQSLNLLKTEKERDLANKNNSLFIERDQCLNMRIAWPNGPTARIEKREYKC